MDRILALGLALVLGAVALIVWRGPSGRSGEEHVLPGSVRASPPEPTLPAEPSLSQGPAGERELELAEGSVDIEPRPSVLEPDLALEPGITISGRVVDELGLPVQGVLVRAERMLAGWSQTSSTDRTGADGSFVLADVVREYVDVSAEGADLVWAGRASVDGRKGDVHDLVLSVERGACIHGTVVWPDLRPVERFVVSASTARATRVGSGTSGRFRLCGLEGKCRIEVRGTDGGVTGVARVPALEPGGGPLELVLEEVRVLELRGTVTEVEGAPIREFTIDAVGPDSEPRFHRGEVAPDGTFVLDGMEAGAWTVEVRARGYLASSERLVLGDREPPPLTIVLRRGSRIRGTVVDPSGAPVAGAWVGEEAHAFTVRGGPDCSTDAEGRFELQASSARPRILAHEHGLASSEVEELELSMDEVVDGLVLALREACRVEGRVLDERGDAMPGARVAAMWVPFVPQVVESREQGAFQLTGLPPGPVTLMAWHPRREWQAWTTVSLVPGHANPATVRFVEPDPVLVRGHLSRGDRPVECSLWLWSSSSAVRGASVPDGSFELHLPRPGRWRGAVWDASSSPSWEDLQASDVRTFELAISGAGEPPLELDMRELSRLTSVRQLLR